MELFAAGCSVIILGGFVALFFSGNRRPSLIAITSLWTGFFLAGIPVVQTLLGETPALLKLPSAILGGSVILGLDGLSAFFSLPVLIVAPLAATFGSAYLQEGKRTTSASWMFYNLLTANMLLLMVARNALVFLIVWELMAISSFFLVLYDHEKAKVREAGWIYLVSTHVGTIALFFLFLLLGKSSGSLDFSQLGVAGMSSGAVTVLFLLAIVGFGSKAGFFPLHVWLPEAHPAAPSHVSALMSGVMIKTGIYGFLRVLTFLGAPRELWGWMLIGIGVSSGILGVLFALAQHDIKRLLAYHSVENIGIITLGLGTGVLGLAWKNDLLVILGFGGGILHVLNHAVFKSLLFMGAGAVIHQTGIRDMDQLGGLIKKMKWTAYTFLIASVAISGLPPLNGFVSEFLIYSSGINAVTRGSAQYVVLAISICVGLALIGGLAAACFAKAFGTVFLGEPRTETGKTVSEAPFEMVFPMVILAGLSVVLGLGAPVALKIVMPAVASLAPASVSVMSHRSMIPDALMMIILSSAGLLVLIGVLYLLRTWLLRGRRQTVVGTWDCGYIRPETSMQYSSSSFAEPITELFTPVLRTEKHGPEVTGFFPRETRFSTHTSDVALEKMFRRIFLFVDRAITPLRRFQHGKIHGYLLYIAVTLIVLLIWKA